MKNFILTFALTILVGFGANAQNAKGDWYVGTGRCKCCMDRMGNGTNIRLRSIR